MGQGNILSGVPLCSHPYRSTIIISVICDLFFSGRVLFVARHQSLFPSHRGPDGVVSWEVLKTMVALVATGVSIPILIVARHSIGFEISAAFCSTQRVGHRRA
jgi:hypothetical protein